MDELIGREVEITKSSDRSLVGIKGRIVDETMHLLVIERSGREIRVPKAACTFTIDGVRIEGRWIVARPEDRIKKWWRYFARR